MHGQRAEGYLAPGDYSGDFGGAFVPLWDSPIGDPPSFEP
jgi:hypothetical protein